MATSTVFQKINFSQINKKASLADRVGTHVKNAGPHLVITTIKQPKVGDKISQQRQFETYRITIGN